MRVLIVAAAVLAGSTAWAAEPALAQVNAQRAARGLPPYREDPSLTAAAMAAADYRAAYRIAGHVGGGMGDFAFLPPGATADAAGCGALEPSWGFAACCVYESYQYAGAARVMGADGRFYNHIFVKGGNAAAQGQAVQPPTRSGRRGFFRR